MHLVYVDDSKGDRAACFSALAVPVSSWQASLDHLVGMRRQMWDADRIYIRKELHATEFISGHGRVSPRFAPKGSRVRLYNFVLSAITLLPDVQLFHGIARDNEEEKLFEWLLNRINVNMRKAGSHALLVSDEGKNYDWMLRRMRRFNYIPSQFGSWYSGGATKNIPIDRIVEDITYRNSKRSLFIQAADFCAYALLRSEKQLPSKNKYGIHESIAILEPIMVKIANRRDHRGYGIIRP